MKRLLPIALIAFFTPIFASSGFAQGGVWQSFTRANSGMIGDSIMAITFDAQDSVWIGAWQGVAKQTATGWRPYNTLQYMPSNEIHDMDFVNGSVWTAHHVGITGFDGTTWSTFTEANSNIVSSPVLDLIHDGHADLWLGTARGLGRYSHDKFWTSYLHENTPAMPYNGIEALASDGANNIWMSFIGTAGLVEFPNGSSAAAQYFKQDSIPGFPKGACYVKCLAVDPAGNLWAGTARNGIIRINASGATVFNKANTAAIKNDTIHTLTIDHCGHVWAGTEGGVAMYDGATWTSYSVATGNLLNDYVFVIRVDNHGHVWIGTKGGLTEFKPLPEKVELITPPMNATLETDSVTCQWAWSCPNILAYWHEVADNPSFTNSRIDTTSLSLTQSASKWDTLFANGTTYYWRVKAKNDAGWGPFSNTWTFTVNMPLGVRTRMTSPHCTLMQNYPNPCSDKTTINFEMTESSPVRLKLYDALGCERATLLQGRMEPGRYAVPLDLSKTFENGVYIYRLEVGSEILQGMMQVVH